MIPTIYYYLYILPNILLCITQKQKLHVVITRLRLIPNNYLVSVPVTCTDPCISVSVSYS